MKYKKYFRKTSLKQKGVGDFFLDEIAKKKPKIFLEVGVFHGVTARNVCELLHNIHGKEFKYIGLDLFEENDENKDEDTSDVPKEDNVVDLTNEDFNYSGSDNFRNRPEYKKDSRTKLEYFGYKFFTDNETTFAPNNNIPVQPNYLIGPGDNLKIILYGNPVGINGNYEHIVKRYILIAFELRNTGTRTVLIQF